MDRDRAMAVPPNAVLEAVCAQLGRMDRQKLSEALIGALNSISSGSSGKDDRLLAWFSELSSQLRG